jgi:enhancing lycopene biosynthesis protein 2
VIREVHRAKKPIGAICIAPVIIAKVLGPDFKVKVTIGNSREVADDIESFGAVHIQTRVDEIAVDEKNKVVTTPAYMLAERISQAEAGISKLVKKVIELA